LATTNHLKLRRFLTFVPTEFPFIPHEFNGKRVLVTGGTAGTAGIGKAIVNRLLDGGARVMTTPRKITYDKDEERDFEFIQADLSTSEGCTNVINKVISQFGGIDILVNVLGASSAPSGEFHRFD
jgi:NAD(P)-dependent dehydrogenase (short-subunit alcohol dehydrogenase family)